MFFPVNIPIYEFDILDFLIIPIKFFESIVYNNSKLYYVVYFLPQNDHNTSRPEKRYRALLQPANPIFVKLQRKCYVLYKIFIHQIAICYLYEVSILTYIKCLP